MTENIENGTPLPEAVQPDMLKISVRFEHKKDNGQYSNTTASAWVEGFVPRDANETDIATAQGRLFVSCAAAVYDALDVAYIMDDDGNIRPAESPVVSVEQATKSVERAFNAESQGSSIRVMNPEDQDGDLPDWLVEKCRRDGVTAVYDNRKTRDPNTRQPYFKEAVGRGQQGHGKNGTAKGYWPE